MGWKLGILAGFAAALPLGAQQAATSQSANPYGMYTRVARENLNRVSASATDIEAVLRREPGLMVEFKRWVAKRASNLGQLLSDKDLTDGEIFKRIENDSEARAAATRLLERYGYLAPRPNPDSDVAKEHELVIRERAMQLARIEEQQRTGPPSSAQAPQEQQAGCAAGLESNCAPPWMPQPSEGSSPQRRYHAPFGPAPEGAPFEQPLPSPAPRPAEPGLPGGVPPVETTEEFGATTITAANTTPLNGSGAVFGARPEEALASGGAGLQGSNGWVAPGVTAAESGLGNPYSPYPARPGEENLPPEFSSLAPRSGARGPWHVPGRTTTPALVSRPNPFADIPSLYDMYLQTMPRPAKPERFGMTIFEDTAGSNQILPMDLPVGPNYVVGPGDGLTISLWGSVSQRLFRLVDRTGRLSLPEVGPLLVSGRTLGEVQQAVEQTLRTQFRTVSADVSLTRLRTVRVYVVGDVVHPGAYDISSLSTPLNALFTAGGPTAIGSLRVIKHYRESQLVETVDVYNLLLNGVRGGLGRLEDGDTVLIPPLGPEVTVEGMVRRPAVYELEGEKDLAEVLGLAGGILPAAALRHIEVERLIAHEKRTMLSLDLPETENAEAAEKQLTSFAIQDGDRVRVFPVAPYNQDAVYLEGHVLRPGKYAYHAGMKLTDVVASYKDLLPEPASAYAEIIRLEPPDYRPSVKAFNLAQALANPATAPTLDPLDTVKIFGRYDFEELPTVFVGGDVRRPGLYRTPGQIHLLDAVKLAGGLAPDADTNWAQVFESEANGELRVASVNLAAALAGDAVSNPVLGPRDQVVIHRSVVESDPSTVFIEGEVAHPGRYPLGTNMRISDLLRLGGGLKPSADRSTAELTRFAVSNSSPLAGSHQEIVLDRALAGDPSENAILRTGDVVTVRRVPGWEDIGASVAVEGEVRHPGVYGIRPGERLSAVLERAGGFLPTAYPEGIVFEREDVRQIQQKSRQELIERLRQQSASFRTSLQTSAAEQAQLQQAAYQQSQRSIEALEQAPATGRMVIQMTASLARFARSPNDIALRASDRVTIPKQPSFVLVTGQVYNANAITFVTHRNAGWYVAQAGGPTAQANNKDIFIVRANGSVVTSRAHGWWLHGSAASTEILPGDTIVVPERVIGGSVAWKNLLSIAQLAEAGSVAALAITK